MKAWHPIFFLVWSMAVMFFGVWVGTTSVKGLVASGHVQIDARSLLKDEVVGDYMCLKLNLPRKEPTHGN